MRRPEITAQDFFNLDENELLNQAFQNNFGDLLDNPLAPLLGPFSAMERFGMGSFMGAKEKTLTATATICSSIISKKK
jgi:hypothetical protein